MTDHLNWTRVNPELNNRFLELSARIDIAIDNDKGLSTRLATLEGRVDFLQNKDLSATLANQSRHISDLQASHRDLQNQIQYLHAKILD